MKFTVEVTLRTPVVEGESADDVRRQAQEAFTIICSKLQPDPPSVVEVAVYPFEDIDV